MKYTKKQYEENARKAAEAMLRISEEGRKNLKPLPPIID